MFAIYYSNALLYARLKNTYLGAGRNDIFPSQLKDTEMWPIFMFTLKR